MIGLAELRGEVNPKMCSTVSKSDLLLLDMLEILTNNVGFYLQIVRRLAIADGKGMEGGIKITSEPVLIIYLLFIKYK